MKTLAMVVLSVLFFSACQAKPDQLRPALEEEGELFLYLQPFEEEAERLRFSIEGVSVLKDDGTKYPLSVLLHELKGTDMRRQRLLASSLLPPGGYTGFSFTVGDVSLQVEDGEAALRVPDEPVTVPFPFRMKRTEALALSMEFQYAESIWKGFRFSPRFSIFKPDRPPVGLVGYVVNYGSNNITVFDKQSVQAVAVIATGRGPMGVALDQRVRRAYVAISEDDEVEVIDVSGGDVIDRLRLNAGDKPREPALTPDGTVLLTVNTGSGTVSLIDPDSLIEVERIAVGEGPNSILVDETGRRAFVFNTFSHTISVIDIPDRSVVATVSTEPRPLRGQFSREGDRLYVIHGLTPYLSVFDRLSLSLLQREHVGAGMTSIKVDSNTGLLYLGKSHDGVEVYEPLSFLPVDFIQTRGGAAFMTIDDEENNLYVLNPERKTLMVVNLVGKRLVSEIDVAEGPYSVTLMGER